MQFRVFTVPIKSNTPAQEGLNRFLRGHRVLSVEKRFIGEGETQCWTFCVEYMENQAGERSEAVSGGKVDYKHVLSPEDFEIYSRLRQLRKEISDREAIPAYTIFTNEQLARMVRDRANSKSDLDRIPGVGTARTTRYGEEFLILLREVFPS